jgi:hypothetical protein
MNRVLRPGEQEPEAHFPSNYVITGSISERTPVERVRQRLASGGTMHGIVWATQTQEKPSQWTMEDTTGDRETFSSFDADTLDAILHNKAIGNVGVGLLRHKQTAGLQTLKGQATTSSMVRPLDPDAPIGSRTGIPKAYAARELVEKAQAEAGPSSSVRPSRGKAFRGE